MKVLTMQTINKDTKEINVVNITLPKYQDMSWLVKYAKEAHVLVTHSFSFDTNNKVDKYHPLTHYKNLN